MNFLFIFLLSAALILIQCLIGGTRLLFSFPAYALIAIAALLSPVSLRRPIAKPSAAALWSTVILAGYVLARAMLSPISYLAWPDAYMAAGCLAVYLLTALYLTEARHRAWIVGVLFALVLPEIAASIMQFSRQPGFMFFGFIRPDSGTRASGMFISGNHLAGYLEAVAMFALAITCWSRWRPAAKGLTALVALLCYFGVAMTGSRGGYLSSAFSILVFSGLSIRKLFLLRPGRAWVPTLTIIAGLVVAFTVAIGIGSQSKLIRERAELIGQPDIRTSNWLAALDQFHSSPWIGTGSGTHLFYGRLFRRPQIQTDPVHAHGDYLELIAEYGAAGGALALLFLGIHLVNGLRGARELALRRARNPFIPPHSDAVALNLGALGAVAALLSHSVVDFNMHIPGNALVFAFIFGILANPGGPREPEAPAWSSPTTLLRFGLFALGAGLLAAVFPKYEGEALAEKARVALRDRKYADCIRLSKNAIAAEPLNPNTWFYLGEANRVIGMSIPVPAIRESFLEKAATAYMEGLRRFPHEENLLVRLGQTLDALHRFDEAEQAYLDAIRWDPNLGALYAFYSAHLQLTGQKEAAEKCYEAANRLGTQNLAEIGKAEIKSILENGLARNPGEASPKEIH